MYTGYCCIVAANTCGTVSFVANATLASAVPVQDSDDVAIVQATVTCMPGTRFDNGQQVKTFLCPQTGIDTNNNSSGAVNSWLDADYGVCSSKIVFV